MNKFLLFLCFFAFTFGNAQYLVEENDITENDAERGRSMMYFSFQKPVEHYRLKCEKPQYAKFPKGEVAFREELLGKMRSYLDTDAYAVNGSFFLDFVIDNQGIVRVKRLFPEVQNSEVLRKDLEFAVKKMKTKWQPALCNGKPTNSSVRLRMDFSEMSFDIN